MMLRMEDYGFYGWTFLEVTEVVNTYQTITCLIKSSNQFWYVSEVYGSTDGCERRRLWTHLETKHNVGASPWLVAGHSNVIANPQESSDFSGLIGSPDKIVFDCSLDLLKEVMPKTFSTDAQIDLAKPVPIEEIKEPEPDEEVENEADERFSFFYLFCIGSHKECLIFPGKPSMKKKKVLSNLDGDSNDENLTQKTSCTQHHDAPDDAEGERIIRKSTRTSVIVRQAERDAIRAALQATMKGSRLWCSRTSFRILISTLLNFLLARGLCCLTTIKTRSLLIFDIILSDYSLLVSRVEFENSCRTIKCLIFGIFKIAGYGSESEADEEAATVTLTSDLSRVNRASTKSAVKLQEIGPRMTLQLTKIEGGLCSGEVMFSEYGNGGNKKEPGNKGNEKEDSENDGQMEDSDEDDEADNEEDMEESEED
ncbi:uncharacterized protein [Gossypium hirsutum]|uniref:Uncharacterized protein n=1 Tax=Gossypium hirsutum TaxID=3635 RepID=A0ABM2ZXF4_GOSHI|nr:uncharacterized protein LOC107899756 [Gossypium hirsutum]